MAVRFNWNSHLLLIRNNSLDDTWVSWTKNYLQTPFNKRAIESNFLYGCWFIAILARGVATIDFCNIGVLATELFAKVNNGLERIPAIEVAIKVVINPICNGLNPGKFQLIGG